MKLSRVVFAKSLFVGDSGILMKNVENVRLYRKMGFYEKVIKRIIDVICSGLVLIVFSWLYVTIAILVRIKLGSPVLFTQYRPGLINPETGCEHIFKMYKFRTMTDERDEKGTLLSDEARLTKFGAWLRYTSLDELPEVFNILNGTMTIIGPRPQLVRDMVFMTETQRMRHTAKPGLSGLAQVSGRNAISWEEKFKYDLEYINHVSFLKDLDIIIKTIDKAVIHKDGITDGDSVTAKDFGEYLLSEGYITQEEFIEKNMEAEKILRTE